MSNVKLTSDELSDVMIDSLVLSNMLVEKFEIMEENKLVAHKAKQSVKNAAEHLNNYINKVFNSSTNEEEDKHFRTASNIILIKQERVEKVLADKEILIIDDRKEILKDILIKSNINEELIKDIISDVDDSEILKI